MNRLKLLADQVEKAYKIDIEDLLDLYKRGLAREEIGTRLGVSTFSIRQAVDKLGLPWRKKKRIEAYVKFWIEYKVGEENLAEEAQIPLQENDYLHKKLAVSERAVQRSRDEATHLRAVIRKGTREDTLEEKVLNLVEQALPIKRKSPIQVSLHQPGSTYYAKHVSSLILSDLHVEEAVTKQDVGDMNEYNWEIMETRLDNVFGAWFAGFRGEDRGVVMILGDIISGIIHDTLESTTKSTAEALHDIADILSDYLSTAATIFETVDIHFVSGNHERLSERIKSNSAGMDFGYLFAQILRAKLAGTTNVSMNISTTGYIATKIGNKWLGGMHGDHFRGPKNETRTVKVQEAFKQVLGIDVWHTVEGHVHKFSWHNTNRGASIVNGSLIGSNAYGLTNGYMAVQPSQTIISFLPDGEIDMVKQVFLDGLSD